MKPNLKERLHNSPVGDRQTANDETGVQHGPVDQPQEACEARTSTRTPELNDLANLVLAAFFSDLGRTDECTLMRYNVVARLLAAGYNLKAAADLTRRGRQEQRAADKASKFEPFTSIEEAQRSRFVDGRFVRDQ
jgi:hypothetical protein